MQFTTLATLVLAAVSALAAPHSNLASRFSSHVALTRRGCNPMPSSVDPKMRDTIYKEVRKRTKDEKVLLITFITAYRESMVNNLDCGDQDSVGLFQQRTSMGWGSVKQIMTPSYSIGKFLDALMPIYNNNKGLGAGKLAQMVQNAEAGEKYTENIPTGNRLIAEARASVGDGGDDNNDNNNNNDGPVAPKPKPNNGGAVNVGGAPSQTHTAPAPAETSDNEDDSGCDDSLPPCTTYYVPVRGDNCYRVASKFNLTVGQLHKLNPEIDATCQNLYAGKKYCVAADDV